MPATTVDIYLGEVKVNRNCISKHLNLYMYCMYKTSWVILCFVIPSHKKSRI